MCSLCEHPQEVVEAEEAAAAALLTFRKHHQKKAAEEAAAAVSLPTFLVSRKHQEVLWGLFV